MANVYIIVALAKNLAIGKDNALLWHISEDLKRFKSLTQGNTIFMGRKTYESLPKRPLPNRKHLILSRSKTYEGIENVCRISSIEEFLNYAKRTSEDIYVIGGGEIYKQMLPYATKMFVTEIDAVFEDADTYFPQIKPEEWEVEKESETKFDEESKIFYKFIDYKKRDK